MHSDAVLPVARFPTFSEAVKVGEKEKKGS